MGWKQRIFYFYNLHIKKRENIDISMFSRFLSGGANRTRTDDQSFADSCLTNLAIAPLNA